MSDTLWTLWIVRATNGKYSKLTYVYAMNEQHARERVRFWFAAYPDLTEHHFKPYPGGFQLLMRYLPGTIKVQVKDEPQREEHATSVEATHDILTEKGATGEKAT